MTGSTIDHLVSVTALVAALLVCMAMYSQTLSDAVAYQRNHQVAVKANDLVDSICLSTGLPEDWGQTSSTPTSFGLQSPETGGYSLSPFALQRLLVSGELVYYDRMEAWFGNVSLGEGGYLLVPVAECVDYATAARLLGVNGSYGFQLSIAPTLTVSITEVDADPLRLEVEVRGPGLALSDASLNYCLFRLYKDGGDYPLIDLEYGIGQTDSKGSAILEFDDGDNETEAYAITVYAHLSGLVGAGSYSTGTIGKGKGIIPVIEDFEEGKIMLVHAWDLHDHGTPVPNYFYNATFLLLTENFELRQMQIANSTGQLNYGSKNYATTKLPPSEPGILLVSYRSGGDWELMIWLMPWGIYSLGTSITFGGDPSGRDWVATELRQVTVRQISYQVRLAVWRG